MSAGFQFHSYSLTSLKKNGTNGKTKMRTDTIHVSSTTGAQPAIAKFQTFRERFQQREGSHFLQPPKLQESLPCAAAAFEKPKSSPKEGLSEYDFALVEQDKENTNDADETFASINTLYSKQADRISELQQLLSEEKSIHARTQSELSSAQELVSLKEREIADLHGKCASSKKEEETKCAELRKIQKQYEAVSKEKAALEGSLSTCLEKNRDEKRNFVAKINEINERIMEMKSCYESTELGKKVGDLVEKLKLRDAEVQRLKCEIEKSSSPMDLDQPDNSNDEPCRDEALSQETTVQQVKSFEKGVQTTQEDRASDVTPAYSNEEVENLKIWLHEYQAIIGNCKLCSAAVAEL